MKLEGGVRGAQLKRILISVELNGARNIRPLFPGSKDSELSTYFVMEISKSVTTAIQRIRLIDGVEFVEREVKRKLKK